MWVGRLIGLLVGFYLIKSLPVAVVCFLIGYLFIDRPYIKRRNDSSRSGAYVGTKYEKNAYSRDPHAQQQILEGIFNMLGYVARGAGAINKDHIMAAKGIMNTMGLNSKQQKIMQEAFNQGKYVGQNDIPQGAITFQYYVGKNADLITFALDFLIMMALSDGTLEKEEYERLRNISDYLNVTRESFEKLLNVRYSELVIQGKAKGFYKSYEDTSYQDSSSNQREYRYQHYEDNNDNYQEQRRSSNTSSRTSELDAAYTLLGVSKDASFEDIKRAHKKLMLKYHPDKLASQGLPPEMIKVYTEKAKDIQAAFNLIKESKGY